MKCPKCAYVGFEESARCRHCGYDFSFLSPPAPPPSPDDAGVSYAASVSRRAATRDRPDTAECEVWRPGAVEAPMPDLPLHAEPLPSLALGTAPRPARTPLAVRRASAERTRSRVGPRVVRRSLPPLLADAATLQNDAAPPAAAVVVAPWWARVAAALIDVLVLAGIDLAVIYLTTQLAGVPVAEATVLPLVPMGAFLLGLNAAYLTVFTVNGGQTLGKMALGLRVIGPAGGVSAGTAILRVGVGLAGGVVAGAGFLPALVRADGRALHDYAARTRVVKVEP